MPNRSPVLLVVLALALASVLRLGPGTSTATPAESSSTTTSIEALEEALKSGVSPAAAEPDVEVLLKAFGRAKTTKNDGDLAVIATVPDPADSHAAYRFDEWLEAIETAAQRSGYVLDRFKLPWLDRKSEPSGYREKPGVLLFRKTGSTDAKSASTAPLLVVFLVGETPTSGVHKTAFRNALSELYKFSERPTDIRVVGPSFSGSVTSLLLAMSAWRDEMIDGHKDDGRKDVQIHFVSGSSTQSAVRKILNSPEDKTTFAATVWSDDTTTEYLYGYLRDHHVQPWHIAVLSEADSAYGSDISGQQTISNSCESRKELDAEFKPCFVFRFPMHISQLRAVYSAGKKEKPSSTELYGPQEKTVLDLSSDDAADPLDVPPMLSPGPGNNLAELTLSNIIGGLVREHVTHIGIYATDTRDVLFLTKLIRSYVPDAHFFTTESDTLFTHPQFTPDLMGMLVVSTYPLAIQSQLWHPRDRSLVQFNSQGAQGTFLAMMAAIDRGTLAPSEASDYLVQGLSQRLPGYHPPFGVGTLPPIWISEVGREQMWPIDIRRSNDPITGSYLVQRSRLFILSLAFFVLLSIAGAWFLGHSDQPGLRKSQWVVPYLALVILFFSSIEALVLLGPLDRPYHWVLAILAAIPPVLSVPFGLFLASWGHVRWRSLTIAASVGVLPFAGAFIASSYFPHSAWQIFLFERSTRYGSGVSLVVPLLFLAVGVGAWICCAARRATLMPYLQGLNVFNGSGNHSLVDGALIWQRLQDALKAPLRHPYFVGGWSLVFSAVGCVLLFWRASFFQTLESFYADSVFQVLALILLLGIVSSAYQFFLFWGQLRRLLRRLGYHRLSASFQRLPPKFSRGLGTQLTAAAPTLMEAEESVEQLEALRQGADDAEELWSFGPSPLADVANVRRDLAHDLSLATKGFARTGSLGSKTQAALSKYAGGLLPILGKYWEAHPDLDSLARRARTEREEESVEAPADNLGKWAAACEDFVACQIVAFLNYSFLHLRYLLAGTMIPAICLLLAAGSYPFLAQSLMINFSWTLLLLLAFGYMVVLTQMGRNQLLNLIADKPGKLLFDRTFLSQTFLFGVLPVVTFLGSKFPSLGKILFVWVSPLSRGLNF